MRITREYGTRITDGIFCLMKELGIWDGDTIEPKKPIVSSDPDEVSFLNAPVSGIFLPRVKHCDYVKEGDAVGDIVDPLRAEILDTMYAPSDGMVFTIREYPVVDEGSLIARILGGAEND